MIFPGTSPTSPNPSISAHAPVVQVLGGDQLVAGGVNCNSVWIEALWWVSGVLAHNAEVGGCKPGE